jgi:8-oxo-dGTP pyrophosphatase MutT (NUDIX family)
LITTFPPPEERNAPISSASPPQKSVFSSVETVFVLWLSEVAEELPEELPEVLPEVVPLELPPVEVDAMRDPDPVLLVRR